MSLSDKALEYYKSGYNCSQSVIVAFAPELGLEKEQALQVAAGFGGGMQMGGACGALTGAFMVLGIKHGAIDPTDKESKTHTYDIIKKATEKFKARFGQVNCSELLALDLAEKVGVEGVEGPGPKGKCGYYVKEAAEILEQMLEIK